MVTTGHQLENHSVVNAAPTSGSSPICSLSTHPGIASIVIQLKKVYGSKHPRQHTAAGCNLLNLMFKAL